MSDAVLTTCGTVRVKELEVIAHAIACRGRGIRAASRITGVNCRRQLPVL